MVDRGFTREDGPLSVESHIELTGGRDRDENELLGYSLAAGQRASAARARDVARASQSTRKHKGAKRPNSPQSDASTYQERYAINRHLANAEQEANRLLEFATAEDSISLSLSAQQLKTHLRELWRLRKAREDEWAEVVNILQGAFRHAIPESISPAQAKVIYSIIRDHLALGYVDNTQPKRVRAMLDAADLDPWGAIQLQDDTDECEGRGG